MLPPSALVRDTADSGNRYSSDAAGRGVGRQSSTGALLPRWARLLCREDGRNPRPSTEGRSSATRTLSSQLRWKTRI